MPTAVSVNMLVIAYVTKSIIRIVGWALNMKSRRSQGYQNTAYVD